MRIISGEARGRRLFAPAGDDTRPTSDRVRESLFGILGSRVWDARVLDLFGGTGAMALEALSRGAAHAVIVDSSRSAIDVIRRNAQNVLKEALDERSRIVCADYRSAIGDLREMRFDLVFLDPPYRMTEAYGDAMRRLQKKGLLAEDCVILAEHAAETALTVPEGFERFDARSYGAAVVEFFRETAR